MKNCTDFYEQKKDWISKPKRLQYTHEYAIGKWQRKENLNLNMNRLTYKSEDGKVIQKKYMTKKSKK